MRIKNTILFILLSFVISLTVKSQHISFRNFTTDDGLSHNTVLSVYQDERGFIWMGTKDGVSLYNGKEITVYKHKKNDPNSLVYNVVSQIVGDRQGNVFFITNRGISQYNINEATFTTLVKQRTTAGYFDEKLYFAYGNRIYRYEKDNIKVVSQLPDGIDIKCICLHGDTILAGTSHDGLFLLDGKRTLSHLIPSGHIYDIYRDSSGWYWATSYNGMGLYALKNGEIINHHSSSDPSTISSNQTYRCCEGQEGNIWIGTFRGLNKYDKRTGKFTRYYKEKGGIGFSEPSIWGLCCDHQGTIWAGTYYSGVKFFNPSKQIYQEYDVSYVESEGLSAPTIGKMIEDDRQNLWICTEGGGVCKYDLHSRKFQWYKHDGQRNSISHNNVKSIYYDRKRDALWIGTHMGGLNKLDLKNNNFTHYKKKENNGTSISSDIVMDIVSYGDNLLLSTYNGILVFNPESGKFNPFFSNKEYFQKTQYSQELLIDNHSNLWIVGVHNGIYRYNFKSEVMTPYRQTTDTINGISSDNINGIYLDSSQRLWIYTNEYGLDVYHHDTGKFENFDMENGLGSNVVYAVCELSPDKLIVTTDEGFSILDYSTKTIDNYQKKNKIPLTAVNERSLLKTTTGEIFIGGVNGMISFYETKIASAPRSYNIYPYRLLVDGQEVLVGDETGLLSQDLTLTKKITIGSQYRVFNIEYTTTDYMLYDKEKIVYKLEGFSDIWNRTRDNNTITYTNLPAGKYTLIIKALRNADDEIPECRLEIEILPPFYKTIWAYIIYIVLIASIAYFLIRTYKNRFKLQEALKYEKKHIEDIEQLNREKFRFFTDISHEFRTPLTIIIGQTEMLLHTQTIGTNIYNSILKVHKSCMQLRELISELLDFRKQEQGYMMLKARQHNIVSFLHEHYLTFQEYAAQMQITYKFVKTHNDIQLWYDAKLLQKVMNNLVSNAFKHTPPKGKITISVRKRNDEVLIEVTDNGEGISPDEIDKIFNRFYQTEHKSARHLMGSGIGLALTKGLVELHHGKIEVYSEQNVETTFCVHLKLGKEHLKPEEIIESDNEEELQDRVEESKWLYNLNLQLQEQSEEEKCNTASSPIRNSKILIVEDNEELRDMLVQLFKTFYQVYAVCDGNEGLKMAKQEHPDIIVSDIVMPNLSGIELCKKIKEDIETCHIPVVLLTAKTGVESKIEGLKTGADDYITKPFDAQVLLSRCNNLVNNRIMLQEKFSNSPQTTHRKLANNIVDKAFMDEAIRVIQKHMSDMDFSIDVFAREMNIARTKLFTKLKTISGQTPAEFILTIRLKEAAFLLRNEPQLNISEVSDRVGFSSPQYFRKCFKDKYHVTPLDYRRDGVPKDGAMENK